MVKKKYKMAATFAFMNKTNGYQNVNDTTFFYLSDGTAQLWFLYDWGAETHIFIFYYSSSDLYFLVISKMAISLQIMLDYTALKPSFK